MNNEKTMFEIYREGGYGRAYRVVYYSELTEHNRESQINRAMEGEQLFDGFLSNRTLPAAKQQIEALLSELNDGASMDAPGIGDLLKDFLVS